MPSSQLKRAERSIQTIRDPAERQPETADALQEPVNVSARSKGVVGARSKGTARHTDAMTMPNRT
jgi:hypothetical protein